MCRTSITKAKTHVVPLASMFFLFVFFRPFCLAAPTRTTSGVWPSLNGTPKEKERQRQWKTGTPRERNKIEKKRSALINNQPTCVCTDRISLVGCTHTSRKIYRGKIKGGGGVPKMSHSRWGVCRHLRLSAESAANQLRARARVLQSVFS